MSPTRPARIEVTIDPIEPVSSGSSCQDGEEGTHQTRQSLRGVMTRKVSSKSGCGVDERKKEQERTQDSDHGPHFVLGREIKVLQKVWACEDA